MALTNWDRFYVADALEFDLVNYVTAPNSNVSGWKHNQGGAYNEDNIQYLLINGLSANNVREGLLTFWYFFRPINGTQFLWIDYRNQTPYASPTRVDSGYSIEHYTVGDWRDPLGAYHNGSQTQAWRKYSLAWWEVSGGLRVTFKELISEAWSVIFDVTDPANSYSSAAQNRVGFRMQSWYSQDIRLDEIILYKKRGT